MSLIPWLRTRSERSKTITHERPTAGRRRAAGYRPWLEELENRVLLSYSFPLNHQSWTAMGPGPITVPVDLSNMKDDRVTGRVTGLATAPGNTIYAAAAGGGVWKSTDDGKSWNALTNNLTDSSGNPIPEFMGAIAVAPSNPQVIYAGTGEANNSGDSFWGEGVLVSTNGGDSWTLTGQDIGGGMNVLGRTAISQIAIDPLDAKTAWVAVSNQSVNGNTRIATGIYKTTNSGTTWTDVTALPGASAAGPLDSTDPWSAIVVDPTTSGKTAVLFAAVGNAFGSAGNGIYESKDGGATWQQLPSLAPETSVPVPVPGVPGAVNCGRISLAISHPASAANATVYASIATPITNNASNLQAFDVSTDGGATWLQRRSTPDYFKPDSQGFYDNVVAADPNTSARVYAAGAAGQNSIIESLDGGATWYDLSQDTTKFGPHADHHALTFDSSGRLLDGNDGGVYRLDTDDLPTGGTQWADLNTAGLSINQLTGIALSTQSDNDNVILSGSQDNGTNVFADGPAVTPVGAWSWTNIAGGDGGFVRMNDTFAYQTYQWPEFRIRRLTYLDPNTFKDISAGIDSNDNANFFPPYVMDPNLPSRLILGTDQLYEATNNGDSGWKVLGTFPNRTKVNVGPGGTVYVTGTPIDCIAIAPSDSNTIYVSAGSKVYVTSNNAQTWTDITPKDGAGNPVPGPFHGIAVDPSNKDIAYVVQSSFTTDVKKLVWQTTDGTTGGNWTDISGVGLPQIPGGTGIFGALGVPIQSIALIPAMQGTYVGTDVGVYYTNHINGSKTIWSRLGEGLPNVQVVDLETANYLITGYMLAAGTHGRGVWEIQAPYPLNITSITPPKAVEGSTSLPITVATFSTPDPSASVNDFTAKVSWGDGQSSTVTAQNGGIVANSDGTYSVNPGGHTYGEEGAANVFTVTVTSTKGAFDTRSAPLTILDVVVTSASLGASAAGPVYEGVPTNFFLGHFTANGDPEELDELRASVSWGDGHSDILTRTNGGITANPDGSFSLGFSHTYSEEGRYVVAPFIINGSSTSAAGASSPITVHDAPLTITGPAAQFSVFEGPGGQFSAAGEVAAFRDANGKPDIADFRATVNWGDGQTSTLVAASGGIVDHGDGTFGIVAAHTYSRAASGLPFSVAVTDTGGASATASSTLTVLPISIQSGQVVIDGSQIGGGNTIVLSTIRFANAVEVSITVGTPAPGSSFTGTLTTLVPLDGITSIRVIGGTGHDLVQIRSTPARVSTEVVDPDHDELDIGQDGSVQRIRGPVTLVGADAAILLIDDSKDEQPRTVTLSTVVLPDDGDEDSDTFGQIVGLAPAPIRYEYATTSSLTVLTGSGGAVVNVQTTGVATNLIPGGVGDTIKLGDTTHSLNAFVGSVNVTGSTGTHLILDDEATQNTITASPGSDPQINRNTPVYTITFQQDQSTNVFYEVQRVNALAGAQETVTFTNASLEMDGANLQMTNDNGVMELLPQYSSSNIFNILGGGPITIKAGDGGDLIQAGDAGTSLDNIPGFEVIGNTGTRLVLDDEANRTIPSPEYDNDFNLRIHYTEPTFVVTGTTASRVNHITDIFVDPDTGQRREKVSTAHMNVQYQNVAALTVNGGQVTLAPQRDSAGNIIGVQNAGNIFNVQGVAAGTTVSMRTGTGYDQVNVGSDPLNLSQSTLDPIQGPVSILGSGNTSLTVHDDGATDSQDYSVYADSIHRFDVTTLAPNMAAIGYSGIGHLTLYQGSAQAVYNFGAIRNTLVVWSSAFGTTTDIYGGAGANYDEVRPYDADPGTPADNRGIQGDVHFHGNNRFDSLGYYDYLHSTGQQTYTLSADANGGQIVDSGFATVTYDSKVVGAGIITSRQGRNTVNVLSTTASAAYGTQIQASTGDHVIVGMPVASGGRTLAGINGFLSIFSVDGNPNVVPAGVLIDDSGDTAPHPAVVINGAGANPGPDVVGLAPAIISWRSLAPTTPVQILGGSGGNTFALTGLPTNPLTLDGGAGTHNKLDYSAYTGDVKVVLPKGLATGFANVAHIRDVSGGNGNSLLVGDANANTLIGGAGRNVIIGGAGGDILDASKSSGDNILIGGTTDWDSNLDALDAIFAEWTRLDLGFDDRFSDLTTFTNSVKALPKNVVNGYPILLTNAPVVVKGIKINPTVHADTSSDALTGSTKDTARNWFIVDGDDTITGGLPRKGVDKLIKAK